MTELREKNDIGLAYTQTEPEKLEAEGAGVAFEDNPVMAIRDSAPLWFASRRQQIDELRHLGQNWDSYGAPPIDPRSIEFAAQVLDRIASFVSVPEPTVTASPTGNAAFAFCWDEGQRSLDLEFHADGTLEFVYLDERDDGLDEQAETRDLRRIVWLLTSP